VSEARVHGTHAEILHDQIPAASGAFAAGAARVHAVYVEVLRTVSVVVPPSAGSGVVIVIMDS
jgi:hypothetical protein